VVGEVGSLQISLGEVRVDLLEARRARSKGVEFVLVLAVVGDELGVRRARNDVLLTWTDSFARSSFWELPLELLMNSSQKDTKSDRFLFLGVVASLDVADLSTLENLGFSNRGLLSPKARLCLRHASHFFVSFKFKNTCFVNLLQ
jgi:hypothetical protein